MSERLSFRHLQPFSALMQEVYYINERIMTGDIVSSKFALPVVRKAIDEHAELMVKDGASQVRIEPYCAAGGWVGLTYSYVLNGDFTFQGSCVPRRIS